MGIIVTALLACLTGLLSLLSSSYTLALVGSIFVLHGILVYFFGLGATNLPFFVAVTAAVLLVIRGQWVMPPVQIPVMFIGLFLWMVVVSLFSPDHGRAFGELFRYGKALILAVFVCGVLARSEEYDKIATGLLAAIVLGAIFNFYQQYTGQHIIQSDWDPLRSRAAGVRLDPNDAAMILLVGLPLAWQRYYAWHQPIWKLIAAAMFALVAGAIVLTGSRAGSLVMLAVLGILFVKRPSIAGAIGAVALAVGVFALAPEYYFDRMNTLIEGEEHLGGYSLQGRWLLLTQGIQIAFDNPIVGVGLGHFGGALVASFDGLGGRGMNAGGPVAHNLYLQIFVETGVIGGLLYVLGLIMGVLGLKKVDAVRRINAGTLGNPDGPSVTSALMVGLLSMLIMGMTLSQGHNSVLWFIVGLGWAGHAISARHASAGAGLRQPIVTTSNIRMRQT